MTKLILNIEDENKVVFFKNLIKSLDFVEIIEEINNTDSIILNPLLKNIKNGFDEIKLIESAKIKSRTAKEFLDEL